MGGIDPLLEGQSHPVSFTVGARRLVAVKRQLVPLTFTLEQAMTKRMPDLPDVETSDGLRVLSAPAGMAGEIGAAYPGFLVGGEQIFARSYIDMAGSFDEYLAGFSGKTRSTLKRKRRRLEKAGGGALDVRGYATPDEMSEFLALAQPLARRTYQARLLDAGLPDGEVARAEMLERASNDRVRAYLLFLHGKPIAYLYLPVEGATLIYAYLGYDPDHAELSPGTVLQMAALQQLFAEKRFSYFDFTEGTGAHKALFGTHSVDCTSFLLLRPTFANCALIASLKVFDSTVAGSKLMLSRTGAETAVRKLLRQ